MRSSGAWGVVLLALAAGGLGAWLAFGARDDGAGSLGGPASSVGLEQAGPTLEGALRVRRDEAPDEVRFEVPVRVSDDGGAALAGVRVVARRVGDVGGFADASRQDAREQLLRAAGRGPGVGEPWPVAAEARTEVDGAATLRLTRRGRYELSAEPEAPLGCSSETLDLVRLPPPRPVDLRVWRGSPLRGRVVDVEGRGIEAVLKATSEGGARAWGSSPTATVPGSGAFEFPTVPHGGLRVEVLLPGRMRLYVPTIQVPYEGELLIRVGPSTTLLEGSVRGADGAPVPGAQVAVHLRNGFDPDLQDAEPRMVAYYALTDAEGVWSVSGPYVGTVSHIQAAGPDHGALGESPPTAPWSGLVLARGQVGRVDLVLFRGGVLEGRVLDEATGQPIEGAEVSVVPQVHDVRMLRPAIHGAATDAQGRYRVDGVVLGRSILLVHHASHHLPAQAALRTDEADSLAPPPELAVFVEREGQRLTRDLRLRAGVPVRGRVIDAEGRPVAQAEVRHGAPEFGGRGWRFSLALESGASMGRTIALSDVDGRFEVPGLASGEAWTLRAHKPPWIGEASAPFDVGAQPPAEVVLRMVLGATVAGRLLDGAGRGIPGATVTVHPHESVLPGQEPLRGLTAADGAFRVEGAPPGVRLRVSAWTGGLTMHHTTAELASGQVLEGIELRSPTVSDAEALRALLVDERGEPVRFTTVHVRHEDGATMQVTSDGKGVLHVAHGSPGTLRFTAGYLGAELAAVTLPTKEELRIVWRQPVSAVVHGLVVDARGQPVPLCTVRLRQGPSAAATGSAGRDGPEEHPRGATLVVNGVFRQHVQGPAPYAVSVASPQDTEGQSLNLRPRTVELAAIPNGPLRIELEPGLTIEGRVVDDMGQGVAGAMVLGAGIRAQTDTLGAFRLGGLVEGDVQVAVTPPPPFARPGATAATAGRSDLVIRLIRGLPIAGEVRGPAGTSPRIAWVSVAWKSPTQGSGTSDARIAGERRFRAEGVPADATANVSVQLMAEGRPDGPSRMAREVRPGTENLVIEIGATVRVTGTALEADGSPARDAHVQVTASEKGGDHVTSARVAADGTFELPALEAGVRVWVTVVSGGARSEPLPLDPSTGSVRLVVPTRLPLRGRLPFAIAPGAKWTLLARSDAELARSAVGKLTGAQGDFVIEGITQRGPWRIHAHCPDDDRYVLSDPIEAPSDAIRLTAHTGRSIEGVLLGVGGTPVRNVEVFASSKTWSDSARTDEHGAFRIRGLPPGTYHVRARHESKSATRSGVTDGTRDLRLQLE